MLLIVIMIILLLSSRFTYSTPLIERDIGPFYCDDETNIKCCPFLAHRVASQYHSRAASFILINNSGYNMTLSNVNIEDGRWVTSKDYDKSINVKCDPSNGTIVPGQSEVFASVTSHFLGGLKGYVSFTIHDKISSNFTISWDVGTLRSPKYFFNELSKKKY